MIDTAVAARVLLSLLSIASLWVLLLWFYHDYRVDLFRQRMFELRADLFELGLEGAIAFDDPAYGMLRSTINGHIRFAHRIGVVSFMASEELFEFHAKNPELEADSFHRRYQESLARVPATTQTRLAEIWAKMNRETLDHIVWKSPSMLLLFFVVVVPLAIVGSAIAQVGTMAGRLRKGAARTALKNATERFLDKINETAFAFGVA